MASEHPRRHLQSAHSGPKLLLVVRVRLVFYFLTPAQQHELELKLPEWQADSWVGTAPHTRVTASCHKWTASDDKSPALDVNIRRFEGA